VAAVVPAEGAEVSEDELRAFVRERLRSTKTPERIDIRAELPFNETGKLLRRTLRTELSDLFS
jgi:acyl-CoA synthetase (AMP-forming)/AMP-acid ligase II